MSTIHPNTIHPNLRCRHPGVSLVLVIQKACQLSGAGTLASLLEDASAQESKEIMLAYTLLSIAPKPLTVDELRAAANSVLARISAASPGVGYIIDFDAEDPVQDLELLGLLERHEGGGLGVKDLQAAKRAMSLKRFEQMMERRARQEYAKMRAAA